MIKGFIKFCKKKCWLNFVRENIHPDVNFNVCNGLEHSNLPETFCTRAIPLCVLLYIVAIVQRQLKSRCVHIVKSWIFILTEKKKQNWQESKSITFDKFLHWPLGLFALVLMIAVQICWKDHNENGMGTGQQT